MLIVSCIEGVCLKQNSFSFKTHVSLYLILDFTKYIESYKK